MGGMGSGSSKKIGKYKIAVGRDIGNWTEWRIKVYKNDKLLKRTKLLSIDEATRKYKKLTKNSEIEKFFKL